VIRLYASNETDFTHNRYQLKNAINCEVSEEENRTFSLTLEYPLNTDIQEEVVIKAPTPRGEQLFVVEKVTKTLRGYKAYATDYISYKLIRNFLDDVRPTLLNCQNTINHVLSNTATPVPFTGTSDIEGSKTAYYIRMNPLQALIGADNSILNNFGGYIVRDGMYIHIMKEPKDIGYEIRMGKNLLGVEQNIDVSEIVTRLYPTAVLEDNTVAILPEEYVDSPYVLNYAQPIIREIRVELTTEEKKLSTPIIYDIMRAKAQEEFSTGIDLPSLNYKIDFVQIEKINRIPRDMKYTYERLERLDYETMETIPYSQFDSLSQFTHDELSEQTHDELSLSVHGASFGDPTDVLEKMNELDISHMVNVYVPKLNIYVKARVIKYVYDALRKRFKSIELGDYKPMERYQTNNIVLNMERNLKLKANQTSIETPTHVLTENGFELKDEAGGLLMNKYGSVNNDNFSSRDNVEDGFPLWIPFEIDTDVSMIKRVNLWWKNFPYRASAKSLSAQEQETTSTSVKAQVVDTSAMGGGVSVQDTSEAGGSTAGFTGYGYGISGDNGAIYSGIVTQSGGLVQQHTHDMNWRHTHEVSITIPSHDHEIIIPAHDHEVIIPGHNHGIEFGIVETPITDDTFTIFIDGEERLTVNARTGKADITEWITTVGDHEIELRSTTKKLIHANVALKTYIRG